MFRWLPQQTPLILRFSSRQSPPADANSPPKRNLTPALSTEPVLPLPPHSGSVWPTGLRCPGVGRNDFTTDCRAAPRPDFPVRGLCSVRISTAHRNSAQKWPSHCAGPSNRKVQLGSFLNRAGYLGHVRIHLGECDKRLIRLTGRRISTCVRKSDRSVCAITGPTRNVVQQTCQSDAVG